MSWLCCRGPPKGSMPVLAVKAAETAHPPPNQTKKTDFALKVEDSIVDDWPSSSLVLRMGHIDRISAMQLSLIAIYFRVGYRGKIALTDFIVSFSLPSTFSQESLGFTESLADVLPRLACSVDSEDIDFQPTNVNALEGLLAGLFGLHVPQSSSGKPGGMPIGTYFHLVSLAQYGSLREKAALLLALVSSGML